VFDSLLIT